MKILLDMDGIIADFTGGICGIHGKSDPYDWPEHKGNYQIEKLLGMTPEEMFAPCDEDFWAGLEPTKDAHRIVETCIQAVGLKNVCILSSPTKHNHGCVAGKLRWLDRHFPEFNRQYLFGNRKDFCAHQGNILIDDYEKNVSEFIDAGGRAHLYGRPWNTANEKNAFDEFFCRLFEFKGSRI